MGENIISDKSMSFAVRIINLCKYLKESKKEYDLANQILRSGTSIGANVREAKNAQSTADFISKMNIALKEADETCYWLELFKKAEILTETEFNNIYPDCLELVKILTKIIKTSKGKEK